MTKTDYALLDLTGKEIVGALSRYKSDKLPETNGADFHNAHYRGKSLGTEVTADQWAAISNGTFADMYVGDYWTLGGKVYRIAHFNYWYNTGDTACTTNHVVIVPDASLVSGKMNSSNITTGGYTGSGFYTGTNADESSNTARATALSTVETAFGASHILQHREWLTNAVSSGQASASGWVDSKLDLMNENMVYGQPAFAQSWYETGIDKSQLSLFKFRPDLIGIRACWWLRGVAGSAYFAYVYSSGYAYGTGASYSLGVRPAFGIQA